MLNIVVPMAGRGSRFSNAGYSIPKPLIPVGGKPMIQWVIDNVRPAQPHRFTFICLEEHLATYPEVPATLRQLCPECEIVTVKQVTEGAACTVLLAKDIINTDEPLMIANSDQYVQLNIDEYLAKMEADNADGLIMTFWSDHPKWSYCKIGSDGTVAQVVEKKVVSNEATVGIYNFRRGSDFVRAAESMIARNLRVNNEFYVAPAYDNLIEQGLKVVAADTGKEYDGMYGLGTPDDLDFFKTTLIFEKNRVDGKVLSDAPAIAALSKLYGKFIDSKNIAGVSAMLAEEVAMTDPFGHCINGKNVVLNHIKGLFGDSGLNFVVCGLTSDSVASVIEFKLHSKVGAYVGVYVLKWSNRKICSMNTYWHSIS